MNQLPRIRPNLLRHPLDGQVLVYDTSADRVHLLDSTTACVLDVLEEGKHDALSIVAEVSNRLSFSADIDLVRLALAELRDADLLDPVANPEVENGVSRRDVVRKLAAAGIAGVVIPTIATLTASRAYAQGTLLGVGSACSGNGNCASNRCCGGLCRTASCSPNSGACGAGVTPGSGNTVADCTCCSGFCGQTGAGAGSIKCT